MGTFPDFLGRTSYTMAILFFALKPKVKKLFSIEIVIFNTFALSEAYSEKYRSQEFLSRTNLRKDLIEIIKLLLFTSGIYGSEEDFFKNSVFLQVFGLCMTLK
jgi:hypothetical protein